MVHRTQEKQKRKEKILTTVVRKFIETCAPVSSEFLCEHCGIDCSSATIRNDMSELEKEGFLRHLHTSSGRVPTEKAYRYFVDFFLEKKGLDEEERKFIMEMFDIDYQDLDHVFDNTSQVIADVTREVGVVSFFEKEGRIYKHGMKYTTKLPEFQDIEKLSHLLEFLEDESFMWEVLEKFWEEDSKVVIGSEFEDERFEDFSIVIHSYDTKSAGKGKLAVFGPLRMDYEKIYGSLDFISLKLQEVLWKIL